MQHSIRTNKLIHNSPNEARKMLWVVLIRALHHTTSSVISQNQKKKRLKTHHNHRHPQRSQQHLSPPPRLKHPPLPTRHNPNALQPFRKHVHRQLAPPPFLFYEQRQTSCEPREPERRLGDENVDEPLWEAADEWGCEDVGGKSSGTEEGEEFVEFVFVAIYCWLNGNE